MMLGGRSSRAFTLLELLVVLAMVGLLLGLVVGTMGSSAVGSRQRAMLSQLHAVLSSERVRAMDAGSARQVVLRRPLVTDRADETTRRFELLVGDAGDEGFALGLEELAELAEWSAEAAERGEPVESPSVVARRIDDAWLLPMDERERLVGELAVRFDRRGRADARVWSFVEDRAARGGSGASGGAGLIVGALGFDPLSGAVSLWNGNEADRWYEAAWRETR